MHPRTRIFVAGGQTLIGAALLERLRTGGYEHLVGLPCDEPDLTHAEQVDRFFAEEAPEVVFVAGGQSGGIHLNQTHPADLMRDNLLVAVNVLHSAWQHGVKKLLYLASSCTYPRLAPQPLREESLMTGPLEPTCEAYATAKLAGIKLCQAYRQQHGVNYITAIPGDVFGPHDDFSSRSGHVIPALIRRFHEARLRDEPAVSMWGTGLPQREFLFSRELADACLFVMEHYHQHEPINLGSGTELSIARTAQTIAEVVGYRGRLLFDARKPDGTPRKALDSSKLRALGWQGMTDFETGLRETYEWYLQQEAERDFQDARTFV